MFFYPLTSFSSEILFSIRTIKETEVSHVYNQLHDLVEFEGSAIYFKLTPERMHDELFGPQASWNCIVAVHDNDIIGFCLFSFANTNRAFYLTPLLYIDDIYVKPEYQRLGVGKKLIRYLASIALQKDIARIEVDCMKDNIAGQTFYEKLDGFKKDFIDIYRLDVKSLLNT